MKVVGLVTEYNPFHNGHEYHLKRSKELANASHSIAIMSGNFLQRGEPALLDKWERAKAAVREGVDLVIELPAIFSCNSAEFFAFGSVCLLNELNVVDYISFGSEDGELRNLDLISDILVNEPIEFKGALKKYLDKGYTFPAARQDAIKEYFDSNSIKLNFSSSPNNILGIEYLKALKLLKSEITPLTIKRIKADYNSTEIRSEICSATAIRKLLEHDQDYFETIKNVVPSNSFDIIKKAVKEGKAPVFIKDLEQLILYRLRLLSKKELSAIHDVNEGIENRLKKGALTSTSYNELIEQLKTKRYTLTRLQRVLIKTVLGISKNDVNVLAKELGPQYIRVLGFSKKGAEILKKIKKVSNLPIITNLKRYVPQSQYAERMIEIDTISTNIYTLLYKNSKLSKGGLDYTKMPYIENKSI